MRWLPVGDPQLRLFQSEVPAPARHHFGIDVDGFEAAYGKAKELDVEDEHYFPADVYELPDGAVQMYVRDPAGNLVEINLPDVTTLDRSDLTGIEKRDVPQTGDALSATLYLHRDSVPG